MSFTINLFMWEYQRHLQISLQNSSESLFNEIDRSLKPRVFLLGILTDERTDRHSICLEPDDYGFSVEAFKDIRNLALQLENVNEENNFIISNKEAQKNHEKR